VELDVPESTSRRGIAVCRRGTNGWSFAGADTAGDGVGAELGSLEVLALFRDRRPPAIHLAAPPAASRELVARVVDDGVGLEWRNISMTLDGRSVIAEWDPESERLTGYLRSPLPTGRHELVVEAADRVGNRARKELRFTASR
jgi:hypothetical protein